MYMLHIFSVPRETSRAHGASTHAISLLLRFSASARTAHCRAVLGVVRVQYTLSGHPLKTSRGRRRPPPPATGQTHCAQTRRAFAGHRLRASLLSLRSISALSLSRRRCLPWQGAALRLAVGLACGAPLGAPVGVVLGGGLEHRRGDACAEDAEDEEERRDSGNLDPAKLTDELDADETEHHRNSRLQVPEKQRSSRAAERQGWHRGIGGQGGS